MGCDYWLSRLREVQERMGDAANPRLRDVYSKLADHYSAMQRLYDREGDNVGVVVQDLQGARITSQRFQARRLRRGLDGPSSAARYDCDLPKMKPR